jgi:hypothetical protein
MRGIIEVSKKGTLMSLKSVERWWEGKGKEMADKGEMDMMVYGVQFC